MKILSILLIIISSTNFLLCQERYTTSLKTYDVSSLYKDSIIDYNRVGAIFIGDSLNAYLSKYFFEEYNGQYYLRDNENNLIISIWSKNDETIFGVSVYSSDFRTVEDIKVGLSIENLLSIFPILEINKSAETDEEYFLIQKYSTEKKNTFIVYLESFDDEKLGNYDITSHNLKSKNFRKNGRIQIIEIYNWND